MRTADCISQRGDDFRQLLLRVGDGTEPVDLNGLIHLPSSFKVNNLEELVKFVYPDFTRLENKAILTAKNDDAFKLNELILDQLPGEARTYASADSFVSESGQNSENPGNWLL